MGQPDSGDQGSIRELPTLSCAAVAELLGCSTAYVRGLVRSGELRAIGRPGRIAQADLESYARREGLGLQPRLPGF